MTRKSKKTIPTTKTVQIKNRQGEVVGTLTLYWSRGLDRFVSIPE